MALSVGSPDKCFSWETYGYIANCKHNLCCRADGGKVKTSQGRRVWGVHGAAGSRCQCPEGEMQRAGALLLVSSPQEQESEHCAHPGQLRHSSRAWSSPAWRGSRRSRPSCSPWAAAARRPWLRRSGRSCARRCNPTPGSRESVSETCWEQRCRGAHMRCKTGFYKQPKGKE